MKEIKLSKQGKYRTLNAVALVDDEDFEHVNQWNWYISKHGNGSYARRSVKGKAVLMHRVVLNFWANEKVIDHIDGNGLNNQKSNLRLATRSQNMRNKTASKNGTSKHLGVFWNKRKKKWQAAISDNYQDIYLGRFEKEIDAARAYNDAAKNIHGEFARLNIL